MGRGFYHHPAFLKGIFELFLRVLASRFFCAESQNLLKVNEKINANAKGFTRDQTRDLLVTTLKP